MDRHDNLQELMHIACSAAHALKCIDGHLEGCCDQNGFSYEDAAGCVYSIKRAIHMLSEMVRMEGLKSDPLYPEWGAPLEELQATSQLSPNWEVRHPSPSGKDHDHGRPT